MIVAGQNPVARRSCIGDPVLAIPCCRSLRCPPKPAFPRQTILNHSLRLGPPSRTSSFQVGVREFKRSFFRRLPRPRTNDPFDWTDPQSKMQRVEAVLLISREPLAARQISKLANLEDGTEARSLIGLINDKYRRWGRAFRIERIAGGYQMLTHEKLATWVRRLHGLKSEGRLSDPALETLSIVAYRQPILRADIEQIRGVSCGEVLRQLMEKKFVKISGRSDELGRPFLYSTTRFFLKYFGLDKIEDLPKSDYFRKTTNNFGHSEPAVPPPTVDDHI